MIELNNSKPIKILNKEDNILTLDINTISFGKYLNRGFISQAKIPLKKVIKVLKIDLKYHMKINSMNRIIKRKVEMNYFLFVLKD